MTFVRFLMAGLLCATAAQAEQAKPQPKAKDPNEVVCKRELQIGSLVKTTKICRTRADWTRAREDAQNEGERMMSRTASIPNG